MSFSLRSVSYNYSLVISLYFLLQFSLQFSRSEEHEYQTHSKDYKIITIKWKSRERRSINSVHNAGHLEVTLEDKSDDFSRVLHLQPNNELLSPNYKLFIRGEDGHIEDEFGPIHRENCIFIGYEEGRIENSAAFSNCDGSGFRGVLLDENITHYIEPFKSNRIKREANEKLDKLHILRSKSTGSKCALKDMQLMTVPKVAEGIKNPKFYYNLNKERYQNALHLKDVDILPDANLARVKHLIEDVEFINLRSVNHYGFSKPVPIKRRKRESNNEIKKLLKRNRLFKKSQIRLQYRIETAVFIDDEMYSRFRQEKGSVGATAFIEDYVLAIMNGVYLLYKAPSMKTDIVISVVRLDIFKRPIKTLDKGEGNINKYLNNFCTWQGRQKKKLFPNGDADEGFWDHGLLLTNMDLWDPSPADTEVVGLAWVAGMCRTFYSCTVNEAGSMESVFVITHEMGHNLNMAHDGSTSGNKCDKDKYIMSQSTGAGKVTWSVCSNREVEDFLIKESSSLTCLLDVKRNPKSIDLSTNDKLPGEIFDANDQCIFSSGPNSRPYIKKKPPYNDICHILWCQNGSYAFQAHPALEGTSCDRGRSMCVSGNCAPRPRIPILPGVEENDIPDDIPQTRPKEQSTFNSLLVNIKEFFRKYLSLRRASGEKMSIPLFPKWNMVNFTECSKTCGGGWQKGKIICVRGDRKTLPDADCESYPKPPEVTSCNTLPCF